MNQYFKRQLKTPTFFGSFGIHPQGVLKRASLKLLATHQKHTSQVQISRCQTLTMHAKHLK